MSGFRGRRALFAACAALSVSANAVECEQPGGTFTINQAKFGADGDLDYIAVTFTAKCGSHEELVWSVAYRAPRAAGRLP
jgi:hypothetical protein